MRLVLGIAAAIALLGAAVAVVTRLDNDGDRAEVADVRIAGDPSTVRGVGHFEQDGERLTGFVVVWGLEPNSTHAVHFHGPESRCGTMADPVAVHPDLTADGDGIAYVEVDIAAEPRLLGGGYYYNVHEGPSSQAENPEIVCGDIEPRSVSASAWASAGSRLPLHPTLACISSQETVRLGGSVCLGPWAPVKTDNTPMVAAT